MIGFVAGGGDVRSKGGRTLLLGWVLGLALMAAGCGAEPGGAGQINLYNAPQENLGAIVQRCNARAGGAYRIVLNTLPRDAAGQREQIVRRLAARDRGLDVIGMDVTWTPELAEAGWIRQWPAAYAAQVRQGTLARPLRTAMWDGRLYAAPYNTNVQLLWYRADLVSDPPRTWEGLQAAAARLAAAGKPHYVQVPAAQGEALVVWFNSLVATAGGGILNGAGTAVSLGPPAQAALTAMRTFARSRAADPSLSNTQEDQARLAMESGTAAMQVNWPFVYASMVQNKPDMLRYFRWAPYPGLGGRPGASPLGGANFGVSSYSRNPDAAFRAALCLRDAESQRTAAVKDGLPPTIEALYARPEMAKAYPMRAEILAALETAALRPQTPTYQNLSAVTAELLSPPRSIDPAATLRSLRRHLAEALQSRGVLP
jgi:ABC-type glycerol-3-phosphate transport system substrate-binding protein